MITEQRIRSGGPVLPSGAGADGGGRTAAPRGKRPSSRRPGKVTVDHVIASSSLMMLTIATAIGMCRVFSDWHFLRSLIVMAIVVHVAALVLRVLRVHAVLAMPFAALVVYEVIALLFYRDTMRFGLPARETMSFLRLDLRLVWTQFPSAVPPVPSTGSYLVIATLAIGAVALLADAFAFRAFGRAEAAVPSGVLFIFTAALGTDRNRVASTALWLAVALLVVGLLRALHGGADESWLGRRGRTLRAAAPAAMMCAGIAALVAGIAGPRLPGAHSAALLDTHQTQSDVTEVVSPLVDIRSRLVNRSNTEMFTVEASAGRYWRLSGLSEFDGTQWGLPDRTLEDSSGVLNQPTGSPALQQRITISRMGGNLLPAAFAPVNVSGSGVLWLPDTDTLVVDEGFTEGQVFNVTSTDLHPAEDVLRATTSSSPPSSEFLELPSNFPQEVRDLAQAVVKGATTTYDQARALQDWFRNNFTYDLTVQKGHSEDAILSFLRIQRGYCEQFSATFAAMARSLGIPARVAVGFTQGELQPDGKYHVFGKHAHAWPEVWFDNYGWVAFEPTPGRGEPGGEATTGVAASQDSTPLPTGAGDPNAATAPPATFDHPPVSIDGQNGGQVTTPTTAPALAPLPSSSKHDSGPNPGGWIALGLLGVGLWMALMPSVVRRFTRRGQTPTEQVIDAWHGTIGALQLAGAPPPVGATPMEYAHTVEHRLPVDYRSLVELARFVTRAIYAPSGVGEPAALRAAVLQTQLERVAHNITPVRTRIIARLDPRLVRLQLIGEGRRPRHD